MKTANELAQEYFAKTPMERLHMTLQDYIYDYQQERIDEAIMILERPFMQLTYNESIKALLILKGKEDEH